MKIQFTVFGVAQPGGSKKAFPFRKPSGHFGVTVTDANAKVHDWKKTVAWTARENYSGELLVGPLRLTLNFFRPRPRSHYGSGKNAETVRQFAPAYPVSRPDSTKLLRAVEDALSGVLYFDDAQIIEQFVSKRWGMPARVEIIVETIE